PPLQTAEPGVVFTYPIDRQLDVPLGARIVVTFSDPIDKSALGPCTGQGDAVSGSFCLVGPSGALAATAEVTNDDRSVQLTAPGFEPGTTYGLYVRAPLAPTAQNLPASGPLLRFTTRSLRPRAAAPALVAVNGSDLASLATKPFRPIVESSTIALLFSEPLDPRTVDPSSVQLVAMSSGTVVPATVIAKDVHVAIDPITDLTAGTTYQVRLGNQITDLGGQSLGQFSFTFVPLDSRGTTGPIRQVLRTRAAGDPGATSSRSGATPNVIAMDKPLIGKESSTMLPSAVGVELGDPKALGGPIAFTIRRGQRLRASGLDVKLGGQIPVGLSSGDIQIELLTDGNGRMYRNPYQPATQRPENDRAPLYVDMTLDLAIFATDPTGNAVLAQTVLGIQATGTAIATEGVLDIENVASLDLGLLGVTLAPTNMVLELITDPSATIATDTTAPKLVATLPDEGASLAVDGGVELIFDEPVDLDKLRAGGIQLETAGGVAVPSSIESHGAAIVLRPFVALAYSTTYRVTFSNVRDLAGNSLTANPLSFSTPKSVATTAPMTVVASHPGAPCALTGAAVGDSGRCSGGASSDDHYKPFELAANEAVEVTFSQHVKTGTLVHGATCNAGSVRIEELDGSGACAAVVAGTLLARDRSFSFVPDVPWVAGKQYRLTLVSGGNRSCDANEVCGLSGDAANFDPLAGAQSGGAGGPNLTINFTGTAPSDATFMIESVSPYTDINGSGFVEGGEITRDENRAALRITGTSGAVSNASFTTSDCIPSTPETEACLYLLGAMPVSMHPVQANCQLPGGATAATCMPVTIDAEAMYATSVSMNASVGISISTDTGMTIMRIRQPASGPVTGYIIDAGGMPKLVVSLDLYMDAPDMSLPLSSHDLHSKPLSVSLEGPLTFMPDGRISIALANTAVIPVSVNISAPLGISGAVDMIVPKGEMRLQLLSPALRGGAL
ncbi:MAG: hypothetical protein JWO36_5394, partial [Myxococcales bacterium]|nr:hypothetical protein [Myxococcales bacterium]